jgi:hypothetical protein
MNQKILEKNMLIGSFLSFFDAYKKLESHGRLRKVSPKFPAPMHFSLKIKRID